MSSIPDELLPYVSEIRLPGELTGPGARYSPHEGNFEEGMTPVEIVQRGLPSEPRWAIVQLGFALNRDGKWEYEPLPSSRDDDYVARTRFSLEEALEVARRHRVLIDPA